MCIKNQSKYCIYRGTSSLFSCLEILANNLIIHIYYAEIIEKLTAFLFMTIFKKSYLKIKHNNIKIQQMEENLIG